MIILDYITEHLNELKNLTPRERYNYWLKYTNSSIKDKCIMEYQEIDFDYDEYALSKVFTYQKDYIDRMENVIEVIKQNSNEVVNIFNSKINIKIPDMYIVIYHGLLNSAGQASLFNEKKAIFLGVEKIVELNWDQENTIKNLIIHEYHI